MTNSESIIVDLEGIANILIRKDLCSITPIEKAISALEENDKLKTDVEQFSNELISIRIENELLKKKNELTNHYFEQYSVAIDEIEKLKENYSVLARQYNNVENSSIRYYNEVKQLKSELEQSVKFPLTNADKIRSMSVEEMARILFTLPHEEIQSVKTSNRLGIDLLDVVNWLNSESEVE